MPAAPQAAPPTQSSTTDERLERERHAIRGEQVKRAYRLAGLPARHVQASSAGLRKPTPWVRCLDRTLRIIMRDGLCALIGTPGSGKTQIAVEVARAHLLSAISVRPIRYEVLADAFAIVREAYGPAATRSEMQIVAEFTSPQLLILDEIDKVAGSEAERRLFHRIIDKRYRDLRPTLLIGNVADADGLQSLLEGYAGEGVGPLFGRLRETGGIVIAAGWNFRDGDAGNYVPPG